jgi:hypothetical protein
MNSNIHKFCKKYEAVCKPSSQYWRRTQSVPIKFGEDFDNVMYQELPYQTVPMVEINLPEDRFRALIEHDDFLSTFEHLKYSTTGSAFYDQTNHAKRIIEQHEEECRIRNEHLSVRAAYDQYLTLLNLCR